MSRMTCIVAFGRLGERPVCSLDAWPPSSRERWLDLKPFYRGNDELERQAPSLIERGLLGFGQIIHIRARSYEFIIPCPLPQFSAATRWRGLGGVGTVSPRDERHLPHASFRLETNKIKGTWLLFRGSSRRLHQNHHIVPRLLPYVFEERPASARQAGALSPKVPCLRKTQAERPSRLFAVLVLRAVTSCEEPTERRDSISSEVDVPQSSPLPSNCMGSQLRIRPLLCSTEDGFPAIS